jgi:RNA polymerase sigma-70 factor, ECF subfamily
LRNRSKTQLDHTDEELVQGVCRGEVHALSTLYDRYFAKLSWFASQLLLNSPTKAEDVVQDVFIGFIEDPGKFDQDRRFSTWIYTVTANRCRNALRNEANRSRLVDLQLTGNHSEFISRVESDLDAETIRQHINTAIGALSEKERCVFHLRFEEELSIKEIAAIQNIPEGSVKSGIYYILRKLSTKLKNAAHA